LVGLHHGLRINKEKNPYGTALFLETTRSA